MYYRWYYETGTNSTTIFPLALSLTSGSRRTWPFGNGKVVKPVLPPNQPQGNKWGFKVISSAQTNVCNCTMCTSNDFLIYLLLFWNIIIKRWHDHISISPKNKSITGLLVKVIHQVINLDLVFPSVFVMLYWLLFQFSKQKVFNVYFLQF